MSLEAIRRRLHDGAALRLQPLTELLSGLGVRPNHLTLLGVLLTGAAAWLLILELLLAAGLVWLLASAMDLLDGVLARHQGCASKYGAFLDSTFDRVSEGILLTAIVYYLAQHETSLDAAVAVLALLGSFLISYTRARAEGLGIPCNVGLATRFERVAILALGLLFSELSLAVYVLAALTMITSLQRISYVKSASSGSR